MVSVLALWLSLGLLIVPFSLVAAPPAQADAAKGKSDAQLRQESITFLREVIQGGEFDRAISFAGLVLQNWPGDPEATALLRAAQNLNALPAGYHQSMSTARAAFKTGDYDTARQQAELALQSVPEDAAAKSLLLQAAVRQETALPPAAPTVAASNEVAPAATGSVTAVPAAPVVAGTGATSAPAEGGTLVAAPAIPPADYQAAMSTARAAFDVGDYPLAKAQAESALQFAPGDDAAKQLLMTIALRQALDVASPELRSDVVPEGEPVVVSPPMGGTDGVVLDLPLEEAKPKWQYIAASADIFLGEGTVTLPFGYSIREALSDPSFPVQVGEADRESTYSGASISYGYKKWALDFSYQSGDSSGNATIIGLPSEFAIEDTSYQAYLRYTLRTGRLSAYLRVGVTLVESEMNWKTEIPFIGLYEQENESTDLLGNLGFGARYNLLASERFFLAVVAEAEGFYGERTQDSIENLPNNTGLTPVTVSIDNTLYGGIGRGLMRLEYRFGAASPLRAFIEGGIQGKFTVIEYPDADSFDEELWGPYGKIGLRFNF